MRRPPRLLLLAAALALGGCSTMYYAAMAQLGWAKHDLLAERVQLARDSQDQTRIHCADALSLFRADGGTADATRQTARRKAYQECADSAAEVSPRVAAVPPAADAFFTEWRDEIADATGAGAAREQQRYDLYRLHYDRLLAAMRDGEAATPVVLQAMQAELAGRDPAGASPLRDGAGDLLIRNLQLAIALADQFIAELEDLD